MEFSRLFKERFSVRKFTDKKLSPEHVSYILEAGRLAPTAKNMQPVKVYVLQSDSALKAAQLCTPCIYGAQTVFVICGDGTQSAKHPDGRDFMRDDAAIVTTHMMLAAADAGLGSCWVGMFDVEKTREMLNLPPSSVPIALLPVGYADCPPSERHEIRKSMSDFAEFL